MSEEPHEERVEDQHPIPLSQTLGFGAGTFLTVGVIDLLAHWGPTGLVIGGILAYVAAKQGPEPHQPGEGGPSLTSRAAGDRGARAAREKKFH